MTDGVVGRFHYTTFSVLCMFGPFLNKNLGRNTMRSTAPMQNALKMLTVLSLNLEIMGNFVSFLFTVLYFLISLEWAYIPFIMRI